MQRQRVSADYLQTSAVIDAAGAVHSAVNDPNDYRGPGTGYRLEGDRWALLQALPHELDPATRRPRRRDRRARRCCASWAPRRAAARPTRSSSPSARPSAAALRETIGGIPHEEVLRQVCAGIEEEGVRYRVIRIGRTSDVAFIAHDGAQLAGSGVAIGLQSKGTAVIHRADLQPLDNLELFGMAPLLRPDSYRQIGRNAARYANGGRASPVPLVLDNFARAKLIVRTTLLHRRETEAIEPGAPAVDVALRVRPATAGRCRCSVRRRRDGEQEDLVVAVGGQAPEDPAAGQVGRPARRGSAPGARPPRRGRGGGRRRRARRPDQPDPAIRNAADTVSRTTAGESPRPPSQSASGGPFVVVDVVRTPAANPAIPAVARPATCWRLSRAPEQAVCDEHADDRGRSATRSASAGSGADEHRSDAAGPASAASIGGP